MLRFIVGPAKSGKTAFLHREIAKLVSAGKRAILLVPEQASFQNERALYELCQGEGSAEVLSFTRLSQLLLRTLGGMGREILKDSARALMMSVALEEIRDDLSLYRRHYLSSGFLSEMLEAMDELKNAGVTPEALNRFSFREPTGTFKEKVFDLSLILDAYNAVVERSYLNPSDLITIASGRISDGDYFCGCSVFVDSFYGFTAPEFTMLGEIMKQADGLFVSLCCDRLFSKEPAFAAAFEAAGRLTRLARELSVETAPMPAYEGESRHPGSELPAFELAMRSDRAAPGGPGGGSVRLYPAKEPYDEIRYVAASIKRLVREEGLRYRDVAVLGRDLSRYETILAPVFERYQIPYFVDGRKSDSQDSLIFGVLTAVSIACKGFDTAQVLSLIKSPILGVPPEEAAELENYCYVWSVRPGEWGSPFLNHPDGMVERMSGEATERLSRINALRERLILPLQKLRVAAKSRNAKAFSEGVYRYLTEIGAPQNLYAFCEGMEESVRREFLDRQEQVWGQLMELLDQFAAILGGPLSESRLLELFELSVGTIEAATPPRALDEVLIGTVNLTRPENPKAVFLIGVVEGEFPPGAGPKGILSDAEREKLTREGLGYFASADSRMASERAFTYAALTASESLVFLSYPKALLTGEGLSPSPVYSRALRFAGGEEELPGPLFFVANRETAFCILAGHYREDSPLTASLLTLLSNGRDLERLERAAFKKRHALLDLRAAKGLFGTRMKVSPSRLESFYHCPFSYFAKSGLRLSPRRRSELSPMESGTLIHRVLERLVSRYGGKGLLEADEREIKREILDAITEYLAGKVADAGALPKRLTYNFSRLSEWIYELTLRLGREFSQSLFEPVRFELEIKEGGAVEPIILETKSGAQIMVEGTVDRVDVARVKGEKYVRVVDYKSGAKSFRLSDVFYGLNMQMLIYLFSIWSHGAGELENLLPAGVLYMPALGRYQNAGREEGEAQMGASLAKLYRMSGLLLDDPEVLAAMEPDGKGIFIPVKAGGRSADSLASLAELGKLRRMVESRITAMAQALWEGKIAAIPCEGDSLPCAYCDYRGVCGFEEGDPVRRIAGLDRAQFLEEGEEDGSQMDERTARRD